MKIKFVFLLLMMLVGGMLCHAQKEKEYSIDFQPVFGNSNLVLSDSLYKLANGDTVRIDLLRFYISGIELLKDNKTVWKEKNSFHLVNAENTKSLHLSLKVPSGISFTQLKFNLGIDSTTNVSGAMGGDLDPTQGMYWTWQSGYINFKVEGKSSVCKTRNNEFQFHLGGYQFPNNSLQTILLDVKSSDKIEIAIDVKQLLDQIDLSTQNQIMSPGKDAILIAEKAKKIFIVR